MRKVNYQNPEEDYKFWVESCHKSMRQIGIKCSVRYEPEWRMKDEDEIQPYHLYNLTNKTERALIIEANLKLAKTIREKYLWLLQRKKPLQRNHQRKKLLKNQQPRKKDSDLKTPD